MRSTQSEYRNSDIKLDCLVLLHTAYQPIFGDLVLCMYVNTWCHWSATAATLYDRPLVVSPRLLVCLLVTWVHSNN